jgi:hypothetical protein
LAAVAPDAGAVSKAAFARQPCCERLVAIAGLQISFRL